MKYCLFIMLFCLPFLAGCRSHKASVSATSMVATDAGRRVDSVAEVRSVGSSVTTMESETTVVHLVADSTGTLRETGRDISRTTTRQATKRVQGDTWVFRSEATFSSTEHRQMDSIAEETKETIQESRGRGSAAAFGAGVWTTLSILAVCLGAILYATWKSKN